MTTTTWGINLTTWKPNKAGYKVRHEYLSRPDDIKASAHYKPVKMALLSDALHQGYYVISAMHYGVIDNSTPVMRLPFTFFLYGAS